MRSAGRFIVRIGLILFLSAATLAVWTRGFCGRELCLAVFRSGRVLPVPLRQESLAAILSSGEQNERGALFVPLNRPAPAGSGRPAIISRRPVVVIISPVAIPPAEGMPVLVDRRVEKARPIGWMVSRVYPTHLLLRILLLDPDGAATVITGVSYGNRQVAVASGLESVLIQRKVSRPDLWPEIFRILKL